MKVIRGIHQLKQRFRHPVLTIGIFDGVHLAHQKIIKQLVHRARAVKGTSVVITFTPHPENIFRKRSKAYLITSLEHRIDLIKNLGVDVCLVLDFSQELAKMSAPDFIQRILVNAIGIKELIIGAGFRFGMNRQGSFSLLKKMSKKYGFKLHRMNTVKLNGQSISSSKVRRLIQKGRINTANQLLGRYFSLSGEIRQGSRRGRIWGYPTANIQPHKELLPASGVYAVLVKLAKQTFSGILNIGQRPTFKTKKTRPLLIEVHIFNFQRNIYGKKIKVFFIQRLRREIKFISHQKLIEQIKQDGIHAKEVLHRLRPSL